MLSKLLACAKNEMPGVIMLPSQEVTPDRVVDEVRRMTKMAASEFGIRPDLPTYADLNFHYVRGADQKAHNAMINTVCDLIGGIATPANLLTEGKEHMKASVNGETYTLMISKGNARPTFTQCHSYWDLRGSMSKAAARDG